MRDQFKTGYELADELIFAGDSEGAIKELERIRSECEENRFRLHPYSEKRMRAALPLSYPRLGEQQNCSIHHNRHLRASFRLRMRPFILTSPASAVQCGKTPRFSGRILTTCRLNGF